MIFKLKKNSGFCDNTKKRILQLLDKIEEIIIYLNDKQQYYIRIIGELVGKLRR
jgi:hypothetical protein